MNKTAIKVFENAELGKVRIVMIDNEPWFVGKDVAISLGYSNPRDAIVKHVDDEDKGVVKCDTLGGVQELTIINESGLYSLIILSKLPAAKKFKHWVTHDVLPSIRKTGGYIANGKETDFMNNPESPIYPYIAALTKSIEILQSQVMMLQNTAQQPNYWLWKNHVATPAVSNLSEKLNVDMRAAYDLIYDQMFVTYGFDRSFAMNQFCTKYCVDNASIIDCVADNPIYQQYFVSTTNKLINNMSDNGMVVDDNSEQIPVFVTDDSCDYVVQVLATKLNQTITRTTRQIYAEMNTQLGWKNIMTRRHFNSKKAVIENCKDYKKKFIYVCNRIMSETD